jgi:3-hydroxypropionate dehydrogenase (NADP+)
MTSGTVRVAIVGMGETGRGWASLCAAAGWPVALFDNQAQALEMAPAEIAGRARALVSLGRADEDAAEAGIAALKVGRSLLQACGEAQWIIESVDENLVAKQKLFEAFESVASKARVVTSSSSSFTAKDLVARCRRPDRVLITHPMNPVELISLVELVPGPQTDVALLEVIKGWLRALHRIPVTVKKAIPGNVAGRIAAAVWREAIDLVLKGVIDVDDLDRAVSLGPAMGWAAAGPHLTHRLAARGRDITAHLQALLQTQEPYWTDLASWSKLGPDEQHRLASAVEKAYATEIDQIRRARNRRLAAILRAVEEVRSTQPASLGNTRQ